MRRLSRWPLLSLIAWLAGPARAGWSIQWEQSGLLTSIDFVDPGQGWSRGSLATDCIIQGSTDAGCTWEIQHHPLRHELSSLTTIDMLSRREGWAIGFYLLIIGEPETHSLHTTDGGRSWTEDPFRADLAPVHASFVDEGTGWSAGYHTMFVPSKVLRYDEPSRKPKLAFEARDTPARARGSDTIHYQLRVENLTGDELPVDAWVQITGPEPPGFETALVLRTGITVPADHSGLHPVRIALPGLSPGVYALETILGPAEVVDPLRIVAHDSFDLEIVP